MRALALFYRTKQISWLENKRWLDWMTAMGEEVLPKSVLRLLRNVIPTYTARTWPLNNGWMLTSDEGESIYHGTQRYSCDCLWHIPPEFRANQCLALITVFSCDFLRCSLFSVCKYLFCPASHPPDQIIKLIEIHPHWTVVQFLYRNMPVVVEASCGKWAIKWLK